jgi:hypothetical protein
MKVLYIFITHQNNLNNCYDRITKMMLNLNLDFIIVNGGFIKDEYSDNKKILNLNCNDKYVGLPEKVMKAFHYIIANDKFKEYTHFVKLDDDMIVKNKFNVLDGDYIGNVHYVNGNRRWHMGRTGTFWDQVPYLGEFKPWCMGGFGYIVSRRSMEKIVPNYDYVNHIYEDVYIGILMNSIGVEPKKINIKEYLVSPEH